MITIVTVSSYYVYEITPPGWWLTYPSEKNMLVSWDVIPFPTEWKVIEKSMVPVTTNQPQLEDLRPVGVSQPQPQPVEALHLRLSCAGADKDTSRP